jgi:predicted 2-oxoglutarate/Fe(II)-dependent dioxygenase YbiX
MEHTFELKRVFGNIMKTGSEVNSHNDDGDIYPNKPEIEKHYSGLLFFNDDYEGGELYFENLGVELKPEPGDLILFRGDERRLHGVKQVTSGYRANLIIFFRDFLPVEAEHPPRRFRDIGNAE